MKKNSKLEGNKRVSILTAVMTVAVLMTVTAVTSGCGKSSSSPSSSVVKSPKVVDGSAVRAAFSAADPSVKYPVEQYVGIAEGGGFGDALPQLQRIVASPELTADQKKALEDFIQQIQNHISPPRK